MEEQAEELVVRTAEGDALAASPESGRTRAVETEATGDGGAVKDSMETVPTVAEEAR